MRDRPHPNHKLEWPGGVVPEWARPNKGARRAKGRGPKGARGGKGGGKRERLQKVMAQSGYGSRRNIEILIAQGHITINGEVAKLGDQVGPGDKVKLDGNVINLRFGGDVPRVLLYHKPDNEIVTRDDPENRATVFDKLPKVNGGRWVSVGRLDLNTSGLLIFTTSGELANKLTHPRFEVEREYAVRVMGELSDEQREKLLKTGVDIDGELCRFDSIEDRGGEGSNHWYHVVLREGKNREVRRMMEAVGLMVSRLMRVRFGSVQLPGFLKRGMFREMDEDQVHELLAFAGVNESEEAEDDEEEEAEDDNIGNRYDPAREARMRPPEIDDDIGNRGTYGEGYKPSKQPAYGRAAPRANAHVQGHSQPYGQAQGHGHGQGHGQGQGHGHGQGGKGFKKRGHGNANGNVAHPAAGHAGGGNANAGFGAKRRHKRGKGQGGQAQGQGAQGQPPQQVAAGQGKPHRNRRNKNRNRHRGAGPQGSPGGAAPSQPND